MINICPQLTRLWFSGYRNNKVLLLDIKVNDRFIGFLIIIIVHIFLITLMYMCKKSLNQHNYNVALVELNEMFI